MNSTELWNTFMESGRVADYLRYRDAVRQELSAEIRPLSAEDGYASENGRDRDPRKGDGRE